MIIAKIGDTILKLDSIKDAETLLNIYAKAEHLEKSYDEEYEEYHHPASHKNTLTVEITTEATIVSHDEHLQKKAAKAEKLRLRDTTKEAAAGTKCDPAN